MITRLIVWVSIAAGRVLVASDGGDGGGGARSPGELITLRWPQSQDLGSRALTGLIASHRTCLGTHAHTCRFFTLPTFAGLTISPR